MNPFNAGSNAPKAPFLLDYKPMLTRLQHAMLAQVQQVFLVRVLLAMLQVANTIVFFEGFNRIKRN